MSKLSAKRQITLPAEQCRELGVEPGDDLHCYVANGQLTLVKKTRGSARAILKGVKADKRFSDKESRDSGMS
jgi:bifunctional DNA-binding transcriptional regulator/antitoxin component of YhaV-PrlF toxin-antitoxin module